MNSLSKFQPSAALAALSLILAVGGCASDAVAVRGADPIVSKVDEYMEAASRVKGFSGSVLLAHAGKPIVSRGYGMADVELGVANTPETVFLLGSVTKQFTGMAIAILQERGKLGVQDRMCKYLPECPKAWKAITIQQLLWHTSGIPSYTGFSEFALRTLSPINTAQMIAMLKGHPLDFKPGQRHAYSNSGYFLLGSIIETASGVSYADYLQQNIFGPLGMTHSAYDVPAQIVPNRASGYAKRNGKLFNAAYMDMTMPGAAGALRSTTGDMLLWDQALNGEKLVTRASLDKIFTPHEGEAGYGYGWSIGKQFGRRLIAHGGGIYGFSTHITRLPDDGVAVIVLSNIEGAPSGTIANDLAAIYFGEAYEVPHQRVQMPMTPAALQRYTGDYQINKELIVTVKLEGDNLVADVAGRSKFGLLPESETDFFSNDVDILFRFEADAAGKITGFRLNPAGGGGTLATKIR